MMPDSIHDYTILDELGEGGFGKVFKVESVDKRQYALKLISVTKDNKDDAKK
jgi:serine/threonine protein kinase